MILGGTVLRQDLPDLPLDLERCSLSWLVVRFWLKSEDGIVLIVEGQKSGISVDSLASQVAVK